MTEPQSTPPKKGMSTLGWIAIGCIGLIVLAGIITFACTAMVAKKAKDFVEEAAENPAMVSAEAMVRLSPELELVEKDVDKQTLTIYNKKEDKTFTVGLDEFMSGKLDITTSEGKAVSIDVSAAAGTVLGQIGKTVAGAAADGSASISFGDDQKINFGGAAASDLEDWIPRYPDAEMTVPFSMSSGEGVTGTAAFETGDSVDTVSDYLTKDLEGKGFSVDKSSYEAGGSKTIMLTAKKDGFSITCAITGEGDGSRVSYNFSRGK